MHTYLWKKEFGLFIAAASGFLILKQKKWDDSRKSQVNEALLKQSDLNIVVVSIYANPVLAGGSMFHSILKPRQEHWARTEFDKNGGRWNFSHTMPLYHELKSMSSNVATPNAIVQRFLNEWNRIEKAARPERIWGENSPYAHLVR